MEKVQALKMKETYCFWRWCNDAPVVALADGGFYNGGLGSDATIETADIVNFKMISHHVLFRL